jgi:trehalose 6-phosphate phosphatase
LYDPDMSAQQGVDQAIAALSEAMRSGLVAKQCGFFFDFDGTLAPIQLDPDSVRPVPGVATRLKELAELAGLVALVSGRPARSLAVHFGDIEGIRYFGLYGLETAAGTAEVYTHPVAETYAELIGALAARAEAELGGEVSVERKRVTVALHYRAAPHQERPVARWAEAVAREHGLTVQQGRMVYELKPPGTPTKGSVVRDHAGDLRFVWCFGDDIGDIPAFTSLREIQAGTPHFHAVLVAVHNPESGAELEALSDVVLPAPTDVPVLLDRVLDALRG